MTHSAFHLRILKSLYFETSVVFMQAEILFIFLESSQCNLSWPNMALSSFWIWDKIKSTFKLSYHIFTCNSALRLDISKIYQRCLLMKVDRKTGRFREIMTANFNMLTLFQPKFRLFVSLSKQKVAYITNQEIFMLLFIQT